LAVREAASEVHEDQVIEASAFISEFKIKLRKRKSALALQASEASFQWFFGSLVSPKNAVIIAV